MPKSMICGGPIFAFTLPGREVHTPSPSLSPLLLTAAIDRGATVVPWDKQAYEQVLQ